MILGGYALLAVAIVLAWVQRLPTTAFPPVIRRVVDITRDTDTPAVPVEDSGAIVDVEFRPDQRFDSTGGRWLKHVLGAAAPLGATPTVDDTPAPPGQRTPMLPPPSTPPSGPRRSDR